MGYKKIVLSVVLAITFLSAEKSVYSDSDFVDAETIARKNSREIFVLRQKISQLKEKIEGLRSMVNSQQNEISRLRKLSNNNYAQILNQLSQRVSKLESRKPVVIYKKVETKKFDVDSSAINSNNSNNSNKVEDTPNKVEKETKKESVVVKKEKKVSNKELYKQSVLNFTKRRLTKAENGFRMLLSQNYKKASSSFYLGEIAYYRKKYKDAIRYYQKSATLNENAAYMDKLLLHTAVSLKKIGKTKQAYNFFDAIISSYPDSASAKEAKKYLKK
jgi:TolA-binding protein